MGPLLGSLSRWNSSETTTPILFRRFLFPLSIESNFSLVHTIMSASSIPRFSLLRSPIAIPTFKSTEEAISRNSSTFSDANAFSGTMYSPLLPDKSPLSLFSMARYATKDFPLAVGMVSIRFLPSRAPGRASICGGKSSSIPHLFLRKSTNLESSPSSSRPPDARPTYPL